MIKRTWTTTELESLAAGIVGETGVLREQYCQRAAEALIDFSKCPPRALSADAHLTQPAQAVDVGAIMEVAYAIQHHRGDKAFYSALADKLTAALPNANGKEGS